jgi:ABC-type amino acid transport substrate-binding protein
MRRLLTGALLSVAVLPRAEAADLPEVLKRGTLRALVVVSEEEAYFVSSRPDAPPGFDAEVLEGFARLHKLKLAIVPVGGWDALIPSLLKGKGDLIAGGFTGTVKGTFMLEDIAAAGVTGVDDGIATGGLPAALKAGRITAAVDGLEAALVAQSRDKDLQLGLFLGKPSSLAYGVRKEDPALLAALNEYIGNLRRTPTWGRLVVKYFGEAAPEILRRARAQ